MNGHDEAWRVEHDQQISAVEAAAADDLEAISRLARQWEEYGAVMRKEGVDFEDAGVRMGVQFGAVERVLVARRELDSLVGRLVYEQAEVCEDLVRSVRSQAEARVERLGVSDGADL